jgi:hypothetical protein
LSQNIGMRINSFAAAAAALFIGAFFTGAPVQAAGNQGELPPGYEGFLARINDLDELKRVRDVKRNFRGPLMKYAGIHGAGVSWEDDGTPVIKLLADLDASVTGIPATIGGVKIVVVRTGRAYALNVGCEERGLENCDVIPANVTPSEIGLPLAATQRMRQTRPVPIGVSIGHTDITAGTLGCRVTRGCHKYVLSNAHVLANENAGLPGDTILQPGPIDGGTAPDDYIGFLSESVPILFGGADNKVDAAIAATDASEVAMETRPNGYGFPRSVTTEAEVGMTVQKFGRTTAITHGYIDMIDTNISVSYAGGVANFIEQIVIKSVDTSLFSRPGDSGSLIVIDGGPDDRKAVGLLFASTTDNVFTIANPIDEVLTALDITIDGN